MTTPTKEEITKRAIDLYMQKNHGISCNLPEVDELKEDGVYQEAQQDLMRSEDHAAMDYLEEMANENGFELVKKDRFEGQQKTIDLKTLCSEILSFGGLFLVANKGVGKTTALMQLTRQLRKLPNTRVIIFETFPKWIWEFDAIPYVYIADNDVRKSENGFENIRHEEIKRLLKHNKDLLFCLAIEDIERLSFFMSRVIYDIYRKRYLQSYKYGLKSIKENVVFIVEECQNLFDSTILNKTLFRRLRKIYTESRNFKMHYLMCSQRLQDVNTKIRGRTKLLIGNVNLDDWELKISRLLRNSRYRKEVLNFEVGEFVYPARDSVIRFDKFQQHGKPYEVSKEILVYAQ